MTYDKEKLDKKNREVLERNIEGSREVIEAKEAHDEREHEPNLDAPPPVPKDDPRYGDQKVRPGQDNVPRGGSTGGQIRTGGGFKSSRDG